MRYGALTVCGVLLAACGGSAGGAGSPAPTPTFRTTGESEGTLTFVGSDSSVTGTVAVGPDCSVPRPAGPVIKMSARAPHDSTVGMDVEVSRSGVEVLESYGDYSREFKGAGVRDFVDTVGAHIDTTLTEVGHPDPMAEKLGLGALTSLRGTVSCGAFKAGTSTILVTGSAVEGAVGGAPDTVRVVCTFVSALPIVQVMGRVQAGGAPVAFFLTADGSTPLSLDLVTASEQQRAYEAASVNGVQLRQDGLHVDAVLPEKGGTGRSVHVTGDATCGETIRG